MNRCEATLLVFLGVAGCAAGQESNAPAIIPFNPAHGLVFLTVDVPGHGPGLALLDTGANASAVDPRIAHDLPVTGSSDVVGTTGSIKVENVRVEGLRLGSLELPALQATRRDLSGLLRPEGRAVDMIVGSDALANLVVTFDFVANQLEVSTQPVDDLREGVPMVIDNGIPAIEGKIGGIDVWLRIDTGASLFETSDIYINIPTHTWRALRTRQPGITPSTYFKGSGADGRAVDLPVAAVSGARLGTLELDRVFVVVQPELGYFADPEAKGFVSNNFLRQLGRVTLDYKSRRLRPA